jgi:hypothetical protein
MICDEAISRIRKVSVAGDCFVAYHSFNSFGVMAPRNDVGRMIASTNTKAMLRSFRQSLTQRNSVQDGE